MNTEQVKQFDSIFNALSESLDITETQYEAAVRSYRAVGDWLAKADSVLVSYNPITNAGIPLRREGSISSICQTGPSSSHFHVLGSLCF